MPLKLVAVDEPLPKREATPAQLERLGKTAGYRVSDSGRIVSCAMVNERPKLSYLDPDSDLVVIEGLRIEPGVPRSSPCGRFVVLGEPSDKRIIEVELDSGEGRTIFSRQTPWSAFGAADYVSRDIVAFLWGTSDVWALYRMPNNTWTCSAEPVPIARTNSFVIEQVAGRALVAIGDVTFEIAEHEIVEKKLPIAALPHDAPVVFDAMVPAGSPFGSGQNVYGTTSAGRMLGWVDGNLTWQDLDGSTHAVRSGNFERGAAHPTEERILIYVDGVPHDVAFGSGVRRIADAGRAAYASAGVIATIVSGTLRLVGDDGTERASLPCADHDAVFCVQYGKTILTSGPKGSPAGPRIYEIEDGLAFRSDVNVDVKAMQAGPKKQAMMAEKGRITNVQAVVARDGHYFIAGSLAQGNFVLSGL